MKPSMLNFEKAWKQNQGVLFSGPIFEIAFKDLKNGAKKNGDTIQFFSLSHFGTFRVRKLNQTALHFFFFFFFFFFFGRTDAFT